MEGGGKEGLIDRGLRQDKRGLSNTHKHTPMEWEFFDWYDWNIIHSIGTPLVNCISLRGLKIFLRAHRSERGFILLVHWYDWYDWYEWNIIHSIGTPLVNCISLWGLRIFWWAHRAERGFILLFHWYDWYEWNIIHSIGTPLVNSISLWDLEYFYGRIGLRRGSFYLSIGTIGTNGISFIPLVLHW